METSFLLLDVAQNYFTCKSWDEIAYKSSVKGFFGRFFVVVISYIPSFPTYIVGNPGCKICTIQHACTCHSLFTHHAVTTYF